MAQAITADPQPISEPTIYEYNALYDVPNDDPENVESYDEMFRGVNKFDELQVRIHEIMSMDEYDDMVKEMSFILKDHTNTSGNHKISDNTAIFNMNSATDCPNRESVNCQVPWESCYAGQSERQYGAPLDYRRRQQYLWDCLTADMFVDAFKEFVSRKRKPIEYLRLSEAGDFRTEGDVMKAERIAERLKKEMDIQTYTYSASDYLVEEWNKTEWITVNMSNFREDYGNRHYTAIPKGMSPEEIDGLDDNAIQCPNDFDKKNGVPAEERKKCGECTVCIKKDAQDTYIDIH